MRPLELTMTAFGSYADQTVVPFDRLTHGLYLVTGDTGAGKTTLFDAIMFALYGKASGSERDRNVDMLHSDYVPRSVDSVVRLRFDQDGRVYTVTRVIHYKKKGAGDSEIRALLECDDAPAVEGASKVTARCEALLGLNAEQFRKIIMLAQGEFKAFLKADSDKKADILKKLFDSSAYSWYQALLCGARDALEGRRRARREGLERLMRDGFRPPEGLDDEGRLKYLPGHPALAANLEALAAEEAGALAALEARRGEARRRADALNERRGAARALNDRLDELERAAGRLAELDGRAGEVALRREETARAERALHRALPAIEGLKRAGAELEDALSRRERLAGEVEALKRGVAEAEAGAAGDGAAQEEANRLEAAAREIEAQLPLYAALEEMVGRRAGALKRAGEARADAGAAGAELAQVAEQLAQSRALLASLENVDAEAVAAANGHEAARRRLEALAGPGGIREGVARARSAERALEDQRQALLARSREALEARQGYDGLYARFVAGQAGLLAEELRRQLAGAGSARCPVCGTGLDAHRLSDLAALPRDTPDEKEVQAARRRSEGAEARRSEQYARAEKAAAELEGLRRELVERAKAWLEDCDDWSRLDGDGALDAAVAEARDGLASAEAALEAALARQRQRNGEKAALPALEARQGELADRVKGREAEEQARLAEAGALEAAIAERRSRLAHGDRAGAEAARRALLARQGELNGRVQRHRAALEAARKAFDVASGSLEELRGAVADRTDKRRAAEAALAAALAGAGFADAGEALAALAPIGGGDGEAWLKAREKARHDYEAERANLRERVGQLKGQVGDGQRVDLGALEASLKEAEALWEAENDGCARQQALLENHRGVLAQAREALEALAATDAAWRRIDRLAGLAAGVSGDEGKLSFERYVLGAVFSDILEMANRRLDGMSGGRYELVLRTGAARANAKAGLDVDVLDYSTGQRRPSGSLSGGEAFFTSLALALGLSDVVQSHAGGRRMDALFIDEGFGTLSDDYLDRAVEVHNQLTEGNRLVGIISHVDKLNESIPQKIRVRCGERGSWIEPIA